MSVIPRQVASSQMALQSPTAPSFVNIQPLIAQFPQTQQSVPLVEALRLIQQALDQIQRVMRGSQPDISQLAVPTAAIGDLFVARLNVADHEVLAAVDIGWTPPTGTSTKGGFDAASVTLPALAENVKAIIEALTAAGILVP